MTSRTHRTFAALLATAVLAGCGSDSSTEPTQHQQVDLAAAISQSANGGFTSVPGAGTLSSIPATISTPTIVPSACAYSTSSGGFVCPTVTTNGVTFNITYFLADASGNAQSALDLNTTSSVRTVTDVAGTLAIPASGAVSGGSAIIAQHGDMTLSGLLATSRTLNGTTTGRFDITTTAANLPSLHAVVNDTSRTNNVVLPAAASATSWPTSGTITADAHNSTTVPIVGAVNLSVHSVITFNGTNHPTMVVSIGGTPITCTLDLSGQTAPTCS
jgi:hypothetical protein